MKNLFLIRTSGQIKQKRRALVKLVALFRATFFISGFFLILLNASPRASFADDGDAPLESTTGPPGLNGPLPDIRARTYDVTIEQRSKSNRTYLFNKSTPGDLPQTGRILLLKEGTENVMAFRVIKTYPETNQIAAKRVKRYGERQVLDPGTTFSAIEKLSDIEVLTDDDKNDIKDVEGGYDAELDSAEGKKPVDGAALDRQDDQNLDLNVTIDEIPLMDQDLGWLGLAVGEFREASIVGLAQQMTPSYVGGAGVRIGYTISNTPYLKKKTLQDSLVLEGSLLFSKLVNYVNNGDAYSIAALSAVLRYDLNFNENLALFFDLGLIQDFCFSGSNTTSTIMGQLSPTYPAGGMGLILRVGPSWDLRMDLGFDTLMLDLMLRF